MHCQHCGLRDCIDCIVYLPGRRSCSRCGVEMNAVQEAEARIFYPWGSEIPPARGADQAQSQYTGADVD